MFVELLLLIIVLFYVYNKWAFGYWKKRGVYSPKVEFLFGNTRKMLFCQESINAFFGRICEMGKNHKMIGVYSFYTPSLIVKDPELVKQVLVTDFSSFGDSGAEMDSRVDPIISRNPFMEKGEQWKKVRGLHVRTLTLAKIKDMVPFMAKVGADLTKYIANHMSEPIEVSELSKLYTIDTITACGYGLQPSAFTDANNAFVKTGGETFFNYGFVCSFFFPLIQKILSVRMLSKSFEDFFMNVSRKIVDARKNVSISMRKHVVDHLLKAEESNTAQEKGFTDLEYASHLFTFYLDGVETAAVVLGQFLVELALHQEIQEKIRQEIFTVGTEPDDFDYEKINSLKYLNMAFQEVLRVCPILSALSRTCTQNTVLDGVPVEKGTKVFVPISIIQLDKNHYPEPFKFDPERFAEGKDIIVKGTFVPFGDGPRQCVGMRFTTIQQKLAAVYILQKYKVLQSKNESSFESESSCFLLNPAKGTKLQFQPL